jgi:hypothetical protein
LGRLCGAKLESFGDSKGDLDSELLG